MKNSDKTLKLLAIAVIVILCGSFLACMFNTGLFSVKVKRISFETSNGELSGLLYMPKGASESAPRPTVIVTHGYLNSAEMQDANAIELSRRGYVVLALDQYDHGHSDYKNELYTDASFFGYWLPFWVNSMHDAVAYMYEQPYVLKDAAGNGIIGVTGHSMGGFGTTMAIAMDEQEAMATGIRKIYCGLTEGSDFMYTGLVGVDAATADMLGGGRTQGKVAAHYDEFFFNDPTVEGGTVRYKDYVSTPDGMTFLQQSSPAKANTWYNTSDGGKRIIYEPAQTHPWNHFSKETTGYAIQFYTEAFKGYQQDIKSIDSGRQVWLLKELSECVALVGFVMFILACAGLLLKAPFLKLAVGEERTLEEAPTGTGRICSLILTVISVLASALVFEPLMDGGPESTGSRILFWCAVAAGCCGLIGFVLALVKKAGKGAAAGSCVLTVAGALLALFSRKAMFQNNEIYSAIGSNSVAYWTLGCALIALVLTALGYVLLKDKQTTTLKTYGLDFNPGRILAGICTGILTVVCAYACLFLVDAIFKTDFRIWTFAFKTFDANIIKVILRYLPVYLCYYLVSSAAIAANTNTEKTQGAWGYVLAIILNACGPILWLVRQYGTLFATGVAAHPGSALSGIVLVAVVPTLTIAAIISRNLIKKTGNIWTPAVLNAVLMTTMTIANTMVANK